MVPPFEARIDPGESSGVVPPFEALIDPVERPNGVAVWYIGRTFRLRRTGNAESAQPGIKCLMFNWRCKWPSAEPLRGLIGCDGVVLSPLRIRGQGRFFPPA